MPHDFLNPQLAVRLQYVSLPLEVVGFSLACIEIYRPRLADRIEQTFDKLERWEFPMPKPFKVVAAMISALVTLTFVVRLVAPPGTGASSRSTSSVSPSWRGGVFWLGMWVMYMSYSFGVVAILWVITVLNKLSGGHALGSLGLIIAGLGVLGEVYQVAEQAFG